MGVLTIWEKLDGESTWRIAASAEQGKSVRQYVMGNGVGEGAPTLIGGQDVQDTVKFLIGTTESTITDGRITRKLPKFDPVFTGWAVSDVANIRGVGNPQKGTVRPAIFGTGTEPMANVIEYMNLEATVSFGARPYPILPDAAITPISNDPNGNPWIWKLSQPSTNLVTGNTIDNLPFVVIPEWWRFTTTPGDVSPQGDWVTSQYGVMMLQRANTAAAPHNFVFGGQPRMFLPNDLLSINLYAIPLRWMTSPNSYIRRLRGLINQFAWCEGTTQGSYIYPRGSLLFLTYKQTTYSAVIQNSEAWNWASGVKAIPKLCNIELIFLRTDRYATNPPTPNNTNFVPHMHNALPWLGGTTVAGGVYTSVPGGKLFYYGTDGGPNGTPSFISAPIPHLLFQDPDGPNAVQIPPTF